MSRAAAAVKILKVDPGSYTEDTSILFDDENNFSRSSLGTLFRSKDGYSARDIISPFV